MIRESQQVVSEPSILCSSRNIGTLKISTRIYVFRKRDLRCVLIISLDSLRRYEFNAIFRRPNKAKTKKLWQFFFFCPRKKMMNSNCPVSATSSSSQCHDSIQSAPHQHPVIIKFLEIYEITPEVTEIINLPHKFSIFSI